MMDTCARVLAFLNGPDCSLRVAVDADSSLIASRLLDSLALFELALWIETVTGRPFDPAATDIATAWETPAAIARFVDANGGTKVGGAATAAAPEKPSSNPAPRYDIVVAGAEHAAAIRDLHSRRFRATADWSTRHLAWRYQQGPGPAGRLYVALCDGAVVGMRGLHFISWEVGDRTLAMPTVDDLAIASDHANRGVHGALMDKIAADLKAEGHTYLLSLSAIGVTSVGSRALGFGFVAGVSEHLRKPSHPLRLLRRIRRALDRLPPGTAWAVPRRHAAGIEASEQARPEAMADLLRRLGHDGRLRLRRDAAFLTWRYRKPKVIYRFLYSGGDRLDGYLVLAGRGEDRRGAVRIADWEASDPAIAAALLDAAIRQAASRNLVAWAFGLDRGKRDLLASRGFHPTETVVGARGFVRTVLLKAIVDDPLAARTIAGVPVFDPASWDYRMIFSEAT